MTPDELHTLIHTEVARSKAAKVGIVVIPLDAAPHLLAALDRADDIDGKLLTERHQRQALERIRDEYRQRAQRAEAARTERELYWQSRWDHAIHGRDAAEAKLREIRRLHDDLDAADITDFTGAVERVLDCECHGKTTLPGSHLATCPITIAAIECERCGRPASAHDRPCKPPAQRCPTYDPVTDDCSCVPGIGQPPPAEKCMRCGRPLSAHGPLANCYPLSGPVKP